MKIGDRVVCVKAITPLIRGREYIVYNITNCNKCGKHKLDVGITIVWDVFSTMRMECYNCHNTVPVNEGDIRLFNPNRFRKVEEQVNYVKLEVKIEEPCLN